MMSNPLGRHLLLELYDCPEGILGNVATIEKRMVEAATEVGATIINTTFHHFAPAGVSGVVVIQESHLSIHTWPEYGFAAVDIFTCGSSVDPWQACAFLKRALKSQRGDAREFPRGLMPDATEPPLRPPAPPVPPQRNLWFTERRENLALSLRHAGVIFETQSSHQRIQILNTYGYGKMLVLDGRVMCTERDECVYHEMIAHVPAFIHPEAKDALVIGGGDGGVVRELLRHPNIDNIAVVEIDAEVIEAAKTYLPSMSSGLGNPRVAIHIGDGEQAIAETSDRSLDLILIDVPGGPEAAMGLFTETFYAHVFRCLKPDGIMVAQIAPPLLFDPAFAHILHTQHRVFGTRRVHPYFAFIPTYATGMLCFSFASKDGRHPIRDFDQTRAVQFCRQNDLQYYSPEIHRSCFALPPLIRSHLAGE